MKTYIDDSSAVRWLNGSLILCNEITEIDKKFDYRHFDFKEGHDIFQRYLTNYSEDDVKWIEETFPDIIIGYSPKLDLYVLMVDHYGTSWDYVWTECKFKHDVAPEKDKWKDGKATSTHTHTSTVRWMRCK